MKKISISAILTAALLVGGASTALAETMPGFSTTGASFTGITNSFDPWPCNSQCASGKWSGWNWSGFLKDTVDDANQPFIQSRVDHYGWSTPIYWAGGANTGTTVSRKTTGGGDPAMSGQLHLCRDRGALLPNNCVDSKTVRR